MGGAISRCLRITTALLLVAASWFQYPHDARASVAYLEAPYDHISTLTPGIRTVQHEIGFILPVGAPQIRPTDWVIIDAPGFTQLSPFTDIIGGYGNPVFDATDHQFRATNFIMYPGTSIVFIGGTANNPPVDGDYGITIRVVKNRLDGPVSNSANIIAGSAGNYVVLSAYVTSPLSAVTIGGFASPEAFVSLIENGNVVGTTSSNPDGSFSFYLTALDPGDHTFNVTATDHYSLSTSQTTVQIHTISNTSTNVSGLLLSSTIQANKESIAPGDTLTLSGTAAPNTQINLFTESPLRSYTAQAGNDGEWAYTLPSSETENYQPGQYRAYTVTQDNTGNQSLNSPDANFTVTTPTTGDNPAPACDISHGDLNCDGKTNLTDFSILLYYWGTNKRAGDINSDGMVNLTDFSIMMFYFQF